MNVSVALLPGLVDTTDPPDIAVVIDVLRATSVMATALACGATQIITCEEIAKARQCRDELAPQVLLCGERNCHRIDGFDLGNSPAEYTPAVVKGRTLIMTTTNGTRAVQAVQNAKRIVAGSFLNFTKVIDAISDAHQVWLVCAGTNGEQTREDVLLAGAIAAACQLRCRGKLCGEGALKATETWRDFQSNSRSLAAEFRHTAGGRNLVRYGFSSDLDRCAELDSLSAVPTQISQNPPTFANRNASI